VFDPRARVLEHVPCIGLVFEPYTRDVFEDARAWIADHGIFPADDMGPRDYEKSVLTLAE